MATTLSQPQSGAAAASSRLLAAMAGSPSPEAQAPQPLQLSELLVDVVSEAVPLSLRNPLDDNVYTRLTRNAVFEARPDEVHFQGFQLNRTHTLKLRLVNVSDFTQRLHLLPPASAAFRVTFRGKLGQVAAGMSEEVTVEFHPTELRYYTDVIRVHTADKAGLVVPIHAYPGLSRAVGENSLLPTRHDFGAVPLGTTRRTVLRVHNPSSAAFQFAARIAENTDADEFDVSPSSGELPPNGSAELKVTFTPTHPATRHAKLRFDASDFASAAAPSICHLVGNGAFGKHYERAARDAEPIDGLEGLDPLDLRVLNGTAAIGTLKRLNRGGGAGRGDGATRRLHKMRVAALKETGEYGKLPTHVGPPEKSTTVFDDMPWRELTSTGAPHTFSGEYAREGLTHPLRHYVLSGNHGYVRKTLMYGVSHGKSMGSANETNAAAVAAARRAESEAAFLAEFDRIAKAEKVKEMRFCHAPGTPAMTEEEMAEVVAGRQNRESARTSDERRLARERLTASTGASQGVVCTSSQEMRERALAEYTPRFDDNDKNDWTKRFMTVTRFIRAVHTVIYRLRAEKRLKFVRAMVANIGGKSKDKAAAFVAHEMLAAGRDKSAKSLEMPFRLEEISVVVHPPPQAPDVNFASYSGHEVAPWTPLSRHVPLDVEKQPKDLAERYVREPLAPMDDYLLPFLDTDVSLRTGAAEEESMIAGMSGAGLAVACKETATAAPSRVVETVPQGLLREAVEPLRHGHGAGAALSAAAACGVLGGCRPVNWGVDEGYRIVPKGFAFHDSVAYDTPSMGSFQAMRREPRLSSRWVERRDSWELSPFGPAPFMSGPDPADLYEVSDQERLKDKSFYDIKLVELKDSLGNVPDTSTSASAAADGADAAPSDGKDAPEDGTVDEDATESRDPALLLPRMRHVRALESSKRAARDALDANRVALLRDMSAKLVDPRMRVI